MSNSTLVYEQQNKKKFLLADSNEENNENGMLGEFGKQQHFIDKQIQDPEAYDPEAYDPDARDLNVHAARQITSATSSQSELEERVRQLERLIATVPQLGGGVVLRKGDKSLGRKPCLMVCEKCTKDVLTVTKSKIGSGTFLSATFLFLCTGPIGLFFPFAIKKCKDVVHKCPTCQTVIDVRYVF